MIRIAKRADWISIRAEYIGGDISQRALADKYGVTPAALMKRASREGWMKDHNTAQRDAKGRFIKQEKGKSSLPGKPFGTTDERASLAGIASGAARREKGDLRKLCQLWMEEEVATDKDGKPITGGQMMVKVAVKEVAKGNPRFWELLRDTAGFKPVDKVMVAEIDPEVIDEVEKLVEEAGHD